MTKNLPDEETEEEPSRGHGLYEGLEYCISNLNKAVGSSARRKQMAPSEAGAVVKRPEDKKKVCGS